MDLSYDDPRRKDVHKYIDIIANTEDWDDLNLYINVYMVLVQNLNISSNF